MLPNPSLPRPDLSLDTPREAAYGVVAAWMNGNSALKNAPFLKPEHFSNAFDEAAWEVILQLEQKNIVGEHVLLRQGMETQRIFWSAEVSPGKYLREALEYTERADGYTMHEYARLIYDRWRRRQMEQEAALLKAHAYNPNFRLPPDPALVAGTRGSTPVPLGDILKAEYPAARGPVP
ncbi:MAG TPA: hypothetical protein VMJ64_07395, partial [Anaerolineales bacterium]|nr:hypothetical protein [Anaerolineales bacterium]